MSLLSAIKNAADQAKQTNKSNQTCQPNQSSQANKPNQSAQTNPNANTSIFSQQPETKSNDSQSQDSKKSDKNSNDRAGVGSLFPLLTNFTNNQLTELLQLVASKEDSETTGIDLYDDETGMLSTDIDDWEEALHNLDMMVCTGEINKEDPYLKYENGVFYYDSNGDGNYETKYDTESNVFYVIDETDNSDLYRIDFSLIPPANSSQLRGGFAEMFFDNHLDSPIREDIYVSRNLQYCYDNDYYYLINFDQDGNYTDTDIRECKN